MDPPWTAVMMAVHCPSWDASPIIRSCLFKYNEAHDEGGAVHASQSSPIIESCTFRFNTAGSKGGAISAPDAPLLTITGNCEFTSNNTSGYGGAVSMDSSTAQLETSSFISNIGTDRGGAIFSWKSDLTIDDCTFSLNRSDSTDTNGWHGVGGSIYARDHSLTIQNSDFSNNLAATLGGAIDTGDGCSVNMSYCDFTGNTTGVTGGAARIDGGNAGDIIEWCTFTNNESSKGGGLALENASSTVLNCTFQGNTANGSNPGEDGNGGGILTNQADATFINCSVQENTALNLGGGIYVNSNTIIIESSTICANVPDQVYGSAVDTDTGNYIEDNCNSNLYSNWINSAGGLYQNPDNWSSPEIPNLNSTIIFDLPDSYQITLDADAEIYAIRIRNGHPELAIGNHALNIVNSNSSAIIVGEDDDDIARLTISSGELETENVETSLGRNNGSQGILYVDGSDTDVELYKLIIGDRGEGRLELSGGAKLDTHTAEIGGNAGASGSVYLSGTGATEETTWTCDSNLTIGRGRLDIEAPARLVIKSGNLTIDPQGRLAGNGSIETGDLLNYGSVEPGMNGTPLSLFGVYEQTEAGLLVTTLGPTESSQLKIQLEPGENFSGYADLSGGLIASLDTSFDPALGASFPILTADQSVYGTFDVALMPDLGGNKYMTVQYQTSLRGGAGVDLVVIGLEDLLNFDDSAEIDLTALPESMAVADFDNDGLDDIAVSSTGQINIYLNTDGTLSLNQSIDNGDTTAIDLTVGDFNGDNYIDIAGANGNASSFTILMNNANGTFMTASEYACSTDGSKRPTCLTAADFDNDGRDDIAIGCQINQADDGVVQIWHSVAARNARNGSFDEAQTIELDEVPGGIDPGNVEEDKDLDLAISLTSGNAVGVLRNVSDGSGISFEYDEDEDRYPAGQQPRSIVFDDIDTDGNSDIVTANPVDGTISILLNEDESADRDFSESAVNLPVGEGAQSVSLTDLDGDGDNDIAVIAIADGDAARSLFVLRNDSIVNGESTGQLLLAPAESFDDIIGIPILVDNGNIDEDDLPDLVTINEPESNGLRGLPGTLGLVQRPETSVPCDGDLNDDSVINIDDLLSILSAWGGSDGDANGDGLTNIDDILLVLSNWGDCP